MNQRSCGTTWLAAAGTLLALTLVSPVAQGAQSRPGLGEMEKHDWRTMEERVRRLEEELAREKEAKGKEEKVSLLEELRKQVEISGLVAVEGFAKEGYTGTDESDLTLATVELDFHATLNDWTKAHALLLWEEDDTEPVDLDEAVISLANPEKFPLFLNAGRLYVPFGSFASYMIQEPLTLELGQTRETAVQFGGKTGGLTGSLYGFNGDLDETGRDNVIAGYGASLSYLYEKEQFNIGAGFDFLNNLADSEGVTTILNGLGITTVNDYVPAVGGHLHLQNGPVTLHTEYLTATEEFAAAELPFEGNGAKPAAWQVEAAYTFQVFEKETVAALGYQGTGEALALGLPEDRFLAGLSVTLTDHLSWALELVHDEDYDAASGGTGAGADMVTTQLALEF